jgi:hypothetical protein
MRVRSWSAALVVAALSAGAAAAGDDKDRAGDAAAPKWEYQALGKQKVLERGKNDLTAGLNKFGEEGWELVAVESSSRDGRTPGQATFYFKRQAVAAEGPPGEGDFKIFKLKHLEAIEAAKVLQAVMGDGKRTRIVAEPITNQVLVRASALDLATIEKLLGVLDAPAEKGKGKGPMGPAR